MAFPGKLTVLYNHHYLYSQGALPTAPINSAKKYMTSSASLLEETGKEAKRVENMFHPSLVSLGIARHHLIRAGSRIRMGNLRKKKRQALE